MQYAIEVENLNKDYKSFQLKNVSFQVPTGSIMGFVGENGAGKTTTIKEILNLISRNSGTIKILGLDNIKNEKEIKEQIGVVFDESYFHDGLKLKDISNMMKHIYKNWNERLFSQYTVKFKLPEEKIVKEYSRGMKMKLTIAVALSHGAKLLILDEATSGLDPIVRDEILDIFMEFIQEENHTVFISSHITSDLEKIADYITFIHQGEIYFSKNKEDLMDNYGVIRCGQEAFSNIDKKYIAGYRKNQFGYEVLINNKKELMYSRKALEIEKTTIEEIILFIVRGEKK